MSATKSMEGLIRSSQFGWGLLAGLAAGAAFRAVDRVGDRVRSPSRWPRKTWLWQVGAAPVVGAVSLVLVHRGGLRGAVPQAVVVVMTAVAVPLIAGSDRIWEDGRLTALCLTLSAAGIWACVPDTELARLALGIGISVTLVWCIGRRRRLGWPAVFAACEGLTYVMASGARGRPAASIGAATCLGVLAVVGFAARNARAGMREVPVPVLVLVLDVAGVALASRWAGLLRSVRPACERAFVVLFAVVVLAVATGLMRGAYGPSSHLVAGRGRRQP